MGPGWLELNMTIRVVAGSHLITCLMENACPNLLSVSQNLHILQYVAGLLIYGAMRPQPNLTNWPHEYINLQLMCRTFKTWSSNYLSLAHSVYCLLINSFPYPLPLHCQECGGCGRRIVSFLQYAFERLLCGNGKQVVCYFWAITALITSSIKKQAILKQNP